MDEILEITLFLAATFERLGVSYLVGGSLASSLHGLPRATQDVDLVAALEPEHVPALVAALRGSFYLDEPAIRAAVRQRTSFNVIHLGTLLKADVFVAGSDAATRSEFERRQRYRVAVDPPQELVLASPEDTIAQKLHWFRLGDEVSERQWSDALGVLKVAGGRLDFAYLRRTAALLGVQDLLERILTEVGMNPGREDTSGA
jgi:hypothetical protein